MSEEPAKPSPPPASPKPAKRAKRPDRNNPHPRLRVFGKTLMVLGAGMLFQSCRVGCAPDPAGRDAAAIAEETVAEGAFTGEAPALEPGLVVDRAGALTPEARAALTNEIAALEAATGGGQMGVAIFTTLSGVPVEDASLRIARAWKLGRAEADDGALLLLATKDREVRLEVGLGWEGPLPDARAGEVLDAITPLLKDGDWGGAAIQAVREVRAAVSGEPPPARPKPKDADDGMPWGSWGIVAFFIGFFSWIVSLPDPPRGSGGGGGSSGGSSSWDHDGSSFRSSSSGGGFHGGGGGHFGGGGASRRF